MGIFSFNGQNVYAPQVLVRTEIGANRALTLLPNGVICFVGASDGGRQNGIYQFNDLPSAQRLLRSGDLLDAIVAAVGEGASAGFVAVVANTKTSASSTIDGSTGEVATLSSGDQGFYTNSISYKIAAGTNSGFVFTLTYLDQNNNTITVGGPGTAYDNLVDMVALQTLLVNNSVVTPPASTNLPPVVTLTITTNGVPSSTVGFVTLAGGTGTGTDALTQPEVEAAVDELADVPFDIGHLVKCYSFAMHNYADTFGGQKIAPFGKLRRWIHQAPLTGASATNSKAVNSEAVANSVIAAANAINSIRSSSMVQQALVYNSGTGKQAWMDFAPLVCGRASFVGANDNWGPASPLTKVAFQTVLDVDYVALATTGDVDRALEAGGWIFERNSRVATLGSVQTIQSVTTAPVDPNTGRPWLYSEFSIVRVADAVLANVKATIETQTPRAIGGGNTPKTMAAILSDVVDVLEAAKDNQWIISYDRSSITISTIGNLGDADIVNYSMVPTPPLNHIGVTQTLLAFSAQLTAGNTVSS